MLQNFNQQLRDWFVTRHLKGIFAVTVANPNLRAGAQSLLQVFKNFFFKFKFEDFWPRQTSS